MQKKEGYRNIIIGIVVGAIFFGWWLRGFLYSNWRFRLFSQRSWSYIANEFESGWMLNAKSDWIFLITLLLSIPLFLYLWYLCTKVRWRTLIKKTWKWLVALCAAIFAGQAIVKHNKKKKKVVLAPPPPPSITIKNTSSARPKPLGHSTPVMPVQQATTFSSGPIFSNTTKAASPMDFSSAQPSAQPLSSMPEDISNIPLEDIQLPQREPVVEDIPGLFKEAGYQLIEKVKTTLQTIDFLAVGAQKVFAVLIDRESGDWLAEEEPFNGEAPLWFSEIDHRVSPIYELKQSVSELQAKLAKEFPDKKMQAFMIEEKGNIINAEEMLRIWKELDVVVSRTDVGGTDDLPVTASVVEPTMPASASEMQELSKLFKGDN
ncbi:MAG: hypothetical protein II938_00315 [Alphaproteobacteria bacterium]|nr:hypothetical protein [Alphaproteobacteria bacterium]